MKGESPAAVSITRLLITTPCPVPVLPGTPTTMIDGEPVPIEKRTELCAVDAEWMIGSQRVCDVHLREVCDMLGIDFDGVLVEAFGSYGEDSVAEARKRTARGWADRRRYIQREARSWAASAKQSGLA